MVLFNLVLDVLCRAQKKKPEKKRKQKKKEKDTQIRQEEINLSLSCSYDMILYLKIPKNPTRKTCIT